LKLQAQIRKKAYRWGHYAELIAAFWLIMKGYRILKRRYGARGREIDLFIARGKLIAFVEVKARSDFDAALEAIDEKKVAASARPLKTGFSAINRLMDMISEVTL